MNSIQAIIGFTDRKLKVEFSLYTVQPTLLTCFLKLFETFQTFDRLEYIVPIGGCFVFSRKHLIRQYWNPSTSIPKGYCLPYLVMWHKFNMDLLEGHIFRFSTALLFIHVMDCSWFRLSSSSNVFFFSWILSCFPSVHFLIRSLLAFSVMCSFFSPLLLLRSVMLKKVLLPGFGDNRRYCKP